MRPVILVTGGAGFIGSHTCKALNAKGYLPVVYDDLSNGHEWAVKWGPFERGALGDAKRLTEVIARHRPIAVMHFAAFIEAGESVRSPLPFYTNNVSCALNLLSVMKQAGIQNLVFSSTAAVYGTPDYTPINETHPTLPINPYGRSKLMIEQILADASAADGLRHAVLRYFNAAGADPDGELGEAHDPETHLIPLVIQTAQGLRKEVAIFGTDYDTPDGTCVRDYVHVSDLADAHVLALTYLLNNKTNLNLNLGNGAGFSVQDVITAAREVTGRPIPTRLADRRPGDSSILISDSHLARTMLKWSPSYSDVHIQIEHAWKWIVQRAGKS